MSAAANESSVDTASSSDGASNSTIPSQYKILALTFNQDCTALAMGTIKTYSLFTINQDNKIDETHDCGIEPSLNVKYLPYEEVCIIERLFSSSLIVVVSNQAPRKLRICHFRKGTEIHSNVFPTTILTVKLNRLRLIVCLEETIYVHNMRDMKVIHIIRDIPSNPDGLCALSSNDNSSFLAYPGSAITGEIQIFDTINLKPGNVISAHEGPLAAMSFDMSGTRIATASKKGTVIRIHNVSDGACLFEFRRGVRRVATIYSLAFSPDSMFLAASSNTGTIHIFRLMSQTDRATEASTWIGSVGRLLGDVAYYLPKQTSEVLTQDRSFATVHLQSPGIKTAIAMNILNGKLIVFVAGYDGFVFAYEVNTTEGGECKKITEYLLFNMTVSSNDQQPITTNIERKTVDESTGVYPPNLFRNDGNTAPSSSTETNKKTS